MWAEPMVKQGSLGLKVKFKFSLSPKVNIVMHIHMHGDIFFLFIAIYIHMHSDVSHYRHAYVYSILKSSCIKVYQPMISLADPGGALLVHAPPNRINFIRFRICFCQKVYALEVGTPPTGRCPPNGKSWIRHWICQGTEIPGI